MDFIYRFAHVLVLSLLVGCSTSDVSPESELLVDIAEPDRIRFEGKGSAAGFMLSGSMGPMGIAIGVAIDEGISKEIQSAADSVDFQMESLVRRSFALAPIGCNIKRIEIERYGFKMLSGSGELAVPHIKSKIVGASGKTEVVNYPSDAAEESDQQLSAELDALKSSGQLVQQRLSAAITQLFVSACDLSNS